MRVEIVKLNQLVEYTFTDEGDNREEDMYYKRPSFINYIYGEKIEYGSWDNLKESLVKGYDPTRYENGYIKVIKYWFKNKYYVYDGNHRVRLLKEMMGGEHQVEVKRMNRFSPYLLMLVLIMVLPLKMIKKKINGI